MLLLLLMLQLLLLLLIHFSVHLITQISQWGLDWRFCRWVARRNSPFPSKLYALRLSEGMGASSVIRWSSPLALPALALRAPRGREPQGLPRPIAAGVDVDAEKLVGPEIITTLTGDTPPMYALWSLPPLVVVPTDKTIVVAMSADRCPPAAADTRGRRVTQIALHRHGDKREREKEK